MDQNLNMDRRRCILYEVYTMGNVFSRYDTGIYRLKTYFAYHMLLDSIIDVK